MHKVLAIAVLTAAVALSGSDWGNDVLVWSCEGGLVSPGYGYQVFDGLYGGDSIVFAAGVEYRPGNPDGDRVLIRKSMNDGQTWPAQTSITIGTGNVATSPRTVFCDNGESLLLFVNFAFYNGETAVYCYKYGTTGLNFLSFSQVDRSYPGMGAIRSATVNPGCCGVFHVIMETEDNWLFVSSSTDGVSWSPAQPLAANAARASAADGPGSKVAAAWYDIYQQSIVCATGDQDGFGTPSVVSPAHPDAAPVPVWENSGAEILGVVWHTAGNIAVLSLSDNGGSSWGTPITLSPGSYPFADILSGSTGVAFSLLSPSGDVMAGYSATLSEAGGTAFEARNDHPAFTGNPAVVRNGVLSSVQGLFYMSQDGKDLWFDNSTFTGLAGGADPVPGSLGLSVVPNPSSGMVRIDIAPGHGEARITVFSIDGRAVWSDMTAEHTVQVGVRLPAGVYMVHAVTGSGSATARMIRL